MGGGAGERGRGIGGREGEAAFQIAVDLGRGVGERLLQDDLIDDGLSRILVGQLHEIAIGVACDHVGRLRVYHDHSLGK